MQKLPEDPDRKRVGCMRKEGTLSTKEKSLFSFSSDQWSDNT